jgi:hypothetical protein
LNVHLFSNSKAGRVARRAYRDLFLGKIELGLDTDAKHQHPTRPALSNRTDLHGILKKSKEICENLLNPHHPRSIAL